MITVYDPQQHLLGIITDPHSCGVMRTGNASRGDIALVSNKGKHGACPAALDMPHVVYAECDAADMYEGAAKMLMHGNCIGGVKAFSLPDGRAECSTVGGRYFGRYLLNPEDSPQLGNPARQVAPYYERRHVARWLDLIHRPQMERACAASVPCDGVARPVRAWFGGTVQYFGAGELGRLVERHRGALAGRVGFCNGSVPWSEYWAQLRRVDVAVSPWGLGEACWRDWEGLLAGCAVVKPRCEWVQSATGLYQSEHCEWCEPDWRDLPAAIARASARSPAQREDTRQWALAQRARAGEVAAAAIKDIMRRAAK
jgi:hypothetical protein